MLFLLLVSLLSSDLDRHHVLWFQSSWSDPQGRHSLCLWFMDAEHFRRVQKGLLTPDSSVTDTSVVWVCAKHSSHKQLFPETPTPYTWGRAVSIPLCYMNSKRKATESQTVCLPQVPSHSPALSFIHSGDYAWSLNLKVSQNSKFRIQEKDYT